MIEIIVSTQLIMVYDLKLKVFLPIEASLHAITCYAMFVLNALEYIGFVFCHCNQS